MANGGNGSRKKIIRAIVSSLAAVLLFGSCGKDDSVVALDLPPTPVLTVRANWGVVTSPYLRVRKQPKMESEVVAHLRNSSIAEILAKTNYPETLESETNYWYEISTDGLRGWVFGSYLDFYDSRSKAEQAVKKTTNG